MITNNDCFAYSSKTIIDEKNNTEENIIECSILKRNNCKGCSFYLNHNNIDKDKIELDIIKYGSPKANKCI